ncbi:MAG TPA: DUF1292 domain-containing protein [Erysipelotrichaceae bacterium]|nr:DUF1292 domain-containing protein [Erysipelotrichaceae bacterium]
MKIENENQMVVVDEEGKERLMEILFTYDNEDREASYVFFYDPEDPEQEVTVMRYYDNGELEDIDDDEEYEEVLEVFNAWQEDINIQEGN